MGTYNGGELLEPSNYRNAIHNLHSKFSIDLSSKLLINRDITISDMGVMLVIPDSKEISILIENIQCRVFKYDGTELFNGYASSNEIPSDISNIGLKETDGTALNTVLIQDDDNLSSPILLFSYFTNQNARVSYYYTYKIMKIGVTSTRPNKGISILHKVLDSVSGNVTLDNKTSIRWGSVASDDMQDTPLLVNNTEIVINPSSTISESMNNNCYSTIPMFSIDGSKTVTDIINIPQEMLNKRDADYFKILLATTHGTSVLDFDGGLTQLDLSIDVMSSGNYIHTYTVKKEDVDSGDYIIKMPILGTSQGMVFQYQNMGGEFDDDSYRLKSLPTKSDDGPLTNIWLEGVLTASKEYDYNMFTKEFTYMSKQIDVDGVNTVVGTFFNLTDDYLDYLDYNDSTDIIGYINQSYLCVNNHMLFSQALYVGDLDFIGDDVTWSIDFVGKS